MKKFILFFIILFLFTTKVHATNTIESSQIILFYGTGCPHCTTVNNYINNNNIDEKFDLVTKEIYSNRDNANEYNQILSELNIPIEKRGVPTLIADSKAITGDKPIISYFENQISNPSSNLVESPSKSDSNKLLTLPLVISAAIVDAINPCAFAVLIILMTTILARKNSKIALKSGIAFSTSIFISYLLMGFGLYRALNIPGMSSLILKIVGILAIILGLLNLKDYFWYGKGMLMEVPVSWRPTLKSTIKKITSPLGAFMTGFLVSLLLLPCTSGPYIVILGMLSQKTTQNIAILYLILYNLIFVLPMLIITLLVYKGLNPQKIEKLRQKNLKNLHLIAGLILLTLGVIILL